VRSNHLLKINSDDVGHVDFVQCPRAVIELDTQPITLSAVFKKTQIRDKIKVYELGNIKDVNDHSLIFPSFETPLYRIRNTDSVNVALAETDLVSLDVNITSPGLYMLSIEQTDSYSRGMRNTPVIVRCVVQAVMPGKSSWYDGRGIQLAFGGDMDATYLRKNISAVHLKGGTSRWNGDFDYNKDYIRCMAAAVPRPSIYLYYKGEVVAKVDPCDANTSYLPDTTDLVYHVEQPAAQRSLGTYHCVAVSPTYSASSVARADIEAITRLEANINIIKNDCEEVSGSMIMNSDIKNTLYLR
jgi:hypothetical protein